MKQVVPAWMKPIYDSYHFAPAVIDGEHLRCSGMIGLQPDLSVPEEPAAQFALAFENVRGLLGEVGLTFANVTEMNTYHVGFRRTCRPSLRSRTPSYPARIRRGRPSGSPNWRCRVRWWRFR